MNRGYEAPSMLKIKVNTEQVFATYSCEQRIIMQKTNEYDCDPNNTQNPPTIWLGYDDCFYGDTQ